MMNFCIASPHTTRYWYDYQVYCDLRKHLESLGFVYKTGSVNRIYFLGWPLNKEYADVGPFDPNCNNIALLWAHPRLVNKKQLEKFQHIFVSSVGYNEVLKSDYPILAPSSVLRPKEQHIAGYSCDISFVGNTRVRPIVEKVLPMVRALGLSFKIWGYDWTQYQGNKGAISYWAGDVIPHYDIPILAHNSKVCLVDHHADMDEAGIISHKYIDFLMSGAFVLTMPNKEVLRYGGYFLESKEQLAALLVDDDMRSKIKKAQYDIVDKDNRYPGMASKLGSLFVD